MKVLVVGNGGREHAIAMKLAEGDIELYAAMSSRNPGIAKLAKRVDIFDLNKPESYDMFRGVDIAFIGPEAPLAAGVSDRLTQIGVSVVGPTRALARLEWSKAYARDFLKGHGIEGNPGFSICRSKEDVRGFMRDHPELVVKPDVLTGGKGVKLTGEQLNSGKEVENYAMERINSDGLVVLEEKLIGREFTLQAFTDGRRVEIMPLVRDYKRAFDGDKGPNTGSMGSFSCSDYDLPDLPKNAVAKGSEIMTNTVKALAASEGQFKGILYGGFMHTDRGVFLLEYNVRMGDPEAINVLALLNTSLLRLGWEIVDGRLSRPSFEKKATVCVYLVPQGYPDSPRRGTLITMREPSHSDLYYASVHEDNSQIFTTSSRSLALLAKGDTVGEAREKVYADILRYEGELFFRKDIGAGF